MVELILIIAWGLAIYGGFLLHWVIGVLAILVPIAYIINSIDY